MGSLDRFEDTVNRYAKAIWRSEVEAGNCSTEWPITPEMEKSLVAAARAAAAVTWVDLGDHPVRATLIKSEAA